MLGRKYGSSTCVREYRRWEVKDGFNDTERKRKYERMKECPRWESFTDGSVGAWVRLMVRGVYLALRGSGMMKCKYQDYLCDYLRSTDKWKQRSMYYLNAIDMDKRRTMERNNERHNIQAVELSRRLHNTVQIVSKSLTPKQ